MRIAPKPQAIAGAIPHEAAIWLTDPSFQPQLTWISAAMPTPTSAPTIDWVVETGNPSLVQMVNQVAEPISATTIAMMRTPGLFSKGSMEKMPWRIVLVTPWPRAMAPTNSVMVARHPACTRVRDLEETEVA